MNSKKKHQSPAEQFTLPLGSRENVVVKGAFSRGDVHGESVRNRLIASGVFSPKVPKKK